MCESSKDKLWSGQSKKFGLYVKCIGKKISIIDRIFVSQKYCFYCVCCNNPLIFHLYGDTRISDNRSVISPRKREDLGYFQAGGGVHQWTKK